MSAGGSCAFDGLGSSLAPPRDRERFTRFSCSPAVLLRFMAMETKTPRGAIEAFWAFAGLPVNAYRVVVVPQKSIAETLINPSGCRNEFVKLFETSTNSAGAGKSMREVATGSVKEI